MDSNLSKIINFYKKYTILEGVSKLYYSKIKDINKFSFDYINVDQLKIQKNILFIEINKQMKDFLIGKNWKNPGISNISYIRNKKIPKEKFMQKKIELQNITKDENKTNEVLSKEGYIIDENLLLFSPVFLKLYIPNENKKYFFPLIFIDITSYKEAINNFDYENLKNLYLKINLEETLIIYNDFAISAFMNKKMKELFNDIWYLTTKERNFNNIKDFLDDIYQNLSDKINDKIVKDVGIIEFPNIKNQDKNSPVGLFFGVNRRFLEMEENFNIEKNNFFFIQKNKLLENFLLEDNREIDKEFLSQQIYLGNVFDRPLSIGQCQVLIANNLNKEVIPVFGGPGTGKTTTIYSLIANNVVKRALNIIEKNEDINNSVLILSNSNKSIDNIAKKIDEKLSNFMYYETGNFEKMKNNIEKIEDLTFSLFKESFNEEKYKEIENTIKDTYEKIKKAKNNFEKYSKILKEKMNLKNLEQLKKSFLEENERNEYKKHLAVIKEANENVIEELNNILNINKDLNFYLEFVDTKYFNQLKNIGKMINSGFFIFFDDLFKLSSRKLDHFNKNNPFFKIYDKDSIEEIIFLLIQIKKEKRMLLKTVNEMKKYEDALFLENMYKDNKEVIKNIFEYDDFLEFYRNKTIKLNQQLFLLSKEFLKQRALMNKNKIIETFKKLQRNFYKVEDYTKDIIQYVSLITPVFISTVKGYKNFSKNFNTDANNKNIFDLVIFEESSMTNILDGLIPISHSKRLICIGDLKQLRPISGIDKILEKYIFDKLKENKEFFNKYSPSKISLFHRAIGITSDDEDEDRIRKKTIILDEHRRCQKKIAETFIKIANYPYLKILTEEKPISNIAPFEKRLAMFDVKERNKNEININYNEVEKIKKILEKLKENKNINLSSDVCILTPYLKQEKLLIKELGHILSYSNENNNIGTIHKFQGSEYNIVIFSSVISDKNENLFFINKDVSMVNIAVSRAKELFILVGDKEKLLEYDIVDNYIGQLVKIIEEKGIIL